MTRIVIYVLQRGLNYVNRKLLNVFTQRGIWLDCICVFWSVIALQCCIIFYCTMEWISYVIVQSLSHVWLFATPWTAACQASLSFTTSQRLLKLMSIELVMPSSQLILCHSLLLLSSIFPSTRVFPMSQLFTSGGQSIGVWTSASVLPMNIQDWFPLGWTGLILQSKGLSRVSSNTAVQKHQFFSAQSSL